ncbi:hypothetical protein Htur_4322 (plasmid) [Haloterrigena turkmenica DSM 5511]|uniref:Uncharacterized protein n=1 Tax=Haloterrigena turkmenica (strain ATCC 51198 / DSM 5511 / JCM 9101 / NCIMB 13204 / VKM B-1734 / 4k) TaxID=543526 RepID=D2S192_HALTV|nr:hypothetical protein [Haloterrigena turkmenica]ADB63139.1 hypothetical protein Htur_4322 [Haloterrigena turkmenica DSM 5511]
MSGPRVPRNSYAIYRAVDRIFEGIISPPQGDYHAVVRYMNEELPRFEQADSSYLILGSYRSEYGRRLREFANCLNMPTNAESIVLGDTINLDTAVVPEFDIKINLLGEAADYVAGVYEKESGGESPELGVVRALFANKTFVFPRDYTGLTRDSLETREDVIQAALVVYYADFDHIESEQRVAEKKKAEIASLLTAAREEGIEITERELTDVIKERQNDLDEPPAEYSWVHLSFFKRFEAMNQCHPWTTTAELRDRADEMPGPERPRWETEFDVGMFRDD